MKKTMKWVVASVVGAVVGVIALLLAFHILLVFVSAVIGGIVAVLIMNAIAGEEKKTEEAPKAPEKPRYDPSGVMEGLIVLNQRLRVGMVTGESLVCAEVLIDDLLEILPVLAGEYAEEVITHEVFNVATKHLPERATLYVRATERERKSQDVSFVESLGKMRSYVLSIKEILQNTLLDAASRKDAFFNIKY